MFGIVNHEDVHTIPFPGKPRRSFRLIVAVICHFSVPFIAALTNIATEGGLSFEMRLTSEIPDYFSIKDCFIQDSLPTSPMFRKAFFFH